MECESVRKMIAHYTVDLVIKRELAMAQHLHQKTLAETQMVFDILNMIRTSKDKGKGSQLENISFSKRPSIGFGHTLADSKMLISLKKHMRLLRDFRTMGYHEDYEDEQLFGTIYVGTHQVEPHIIDGYASIIRECPTVVHYWTVLKDATTESIYNDNDDVDEITPLEAGLLERGIDTNEIIDQAWSIDGFSAI